MAETAPRDRPGEPSPCPAAAPATSTGAAIFAGTALAVALSFVLLTFGSAIGLSVVSVRAGRGRVAHWIAIASGIWFLWVAITSFAAGGYLAGRLRRPVGGASIDETEVRDGAHGLVVWAVGALVGAILAASGVTGVDRRRRQRRRHRGADRRRGGRRRRRLPRRRLMRGRRAARRPAAVLHPQSRRRRRLAPRTATISWRWSRSGPGRRRRRPAPRSTRPRRGAGFYAEASRPPSRPAWPRRSPPSSSPRP